MMRSVELVDHNSLGELSIARASAVCYDSNPNDVTRVTRIKKLKHLSCFGFSYATFEFKGISRACADQIRTHRTLNHLMRSQRYCNESEAEFLVPDKIAGNEEARAIMAKHLVSVRESYAKLREAGMKREDARSVLPMSTTTQMTTSGTLEGWLNFLRARLGKHAQKEVREVAQEVLKQLKQKFPLAMAGEGE